MPIWLAVAIGGAIGSAGRYWLSEWVAKAVDGGFPWGTLTVNLLGSLVIGLVAALVAPPGRIAVEPHWVAFVTVGLCGGFTTFSAFSLQTLMLLRQGAVLQAGLNAMLSVLLCLSAAWLGWTLGTVAK
jgi:CrcB protein